MYLQRRPSVDMITAVEKEDRAGTPAGYNCEVAYYLQVQSPQEMFADADGEIVTTFEELIPKCPQHIDAKIREGGYINIKLTSDSFKVLPLENVQLSASKGAQRTFIITPLQQGQRKLIVVTSFGNIIGEVNPLLGVPPTSNYTPITVTVRSPPAFLGMSERQLKYVESAATIVGLPSIALLLIRLFLFGKKSSATQE
jgi:hypothetical protein